MCLRKPATMRQRFRSFARRLAARELMMRNLLANLLGSVVSGALTLLFVPIYLRYIGAESYGLIGFFTSITTLLSLLDGGTGAAATRELARTAESSAAEQEHTRGLLNSLELLFWMLSCGLALTLTAAAPWIAHRWLHMESLSPATVTVCLRLLACTLALQWPNTLYAGCLVGLQRQIRCNLLTTASVALRCFGSVAALWWSPRVETFFWAQMICSLVGVVAMRSAFWASYPGGRPAAGGRRLGSLRPILGFSMGVSGVNALALVLTQSDKLVLSRMVSLSDLGRYTLAWNLAMQLSRVTTAVLSASYPRLTQLLASGQLDLLRHVYRRACLQISLGLLPAGFVLAAFAEQVVWLWTRQAELAAAVAPSLAWLTLGTLCNGLMTMPYALQLASGSTRLSLQTNLVAAVLLPIWVYLGAQKFGLAGAASAWFVLNLLYLPSAGWLSHARFLPGVASWWVGRALLLPALLCVVLVGSARWALTGLLPPHHPAWLPILFSLWCAITGCLWLVLRRQPELDPTKKPQEAAKSAEPLL